MKQIIINTDGGSRGNPGPAAIGYVIQEDGKIVKRCGEAIGKATNNEAEYTAAIRALEDAFSMYGKIKVLLKADSQLMVKQINREYKVKNDRIAKLFVKLYNLINQFDEVIFQHVLREENKEADAVLNEALDNL